MIQIDHLAHSFMAGAQPATTSATWATLTSALALKRPPAALIHAVRDVSLSAAGGHITGLLGPNGAGKTTTLRMLAGLIVPSAGSMTVDGIDVVAQPQAAVARMGVLSDARGLYPRLTARENIVYFGRLHGMSLAAAQARAESLAQSLDMQPLLDRRTEGFSQGERMKTALARALVHDPANIVLMSRPTASMCWPPEHCARFCGFCAARPAGPNALFFRLTSCPKSSACVTAWW